MTPSYDDPDLTPDEGEADDYGAIRGRGIYTQQDGVWGHRNPATGVFVADGAKAIEMKEAV